MSLRRLAYKKLWCSVFEKFEVPVLLQPAASGQAIARALGWGHGEFRTGIRGLTSCNKHWYSFLAVTPSPVCCCSQQPWAWPLLAHWAWATATSL